MTITRVRHHLLDTKTDTVRNVPPSLAEPSIAHVRAVVTDCPRCAWRDFGATGLDRDFAREYRADLDTAGEEAIRQPLLAAWRRRGYVARLVDHRDCGLPGSDDDPTDELYIAVRQEAADQVTGEELAYAAGLIEEHAAWSER